MKGLSIGDLVMVNFPSFSVNEIKKGANIAAGFSEGNKRFRKMIQLRSRSPEALYSTPYRIEVDEGDGNWKPLDSERDYKEVCIRRKSVDGFIRSIKDGIVYLNDRFLRKLTVVSTESVIPLGGKHLGLMEIQKMNPLGFSDDNSSVTKDCIVIDLNNWYMFSHLNEGFDDIESKLSDKAKGPVQKIVLMNPVTGARVERLANMNRVVAINENEESATLEDIFNSTTDKVFSFRTYPSVLGEVKDFDYTKTRFILRNEIFKPANRN